MACKWLALSRRAIVLPAFLLLATTAAEAGGFAVREQSTYGQGASYAGIAAGGDLSAMFWNPAAITQFEGKTVELNASGVLPHSTQNFTNSGLANVLGGAVPSYLNNVQNSADNAFVPSLYASWQLNQRLWLGLSVNSPYALSVSFPVTWAGALYGQGATVRSYNAAPTLAYKINDMISIAVGAQVQLMQVNYGLLAAAFPTSFGRLTGEGYAYGFTAGATITPTPTTVIGVGYRSALDQDIRGNLAVTTANSTTGSISTTLKLPDVLTAGLRQRIGDSFTLLAGFEWSNWSRIGTTTITAPNGTPALVSGSPVLLPFQYRDGYLYSIGGEYMVDPAWTARAGVAFERSPISDGVRTPRLPDNDRTWYSIGFSHKPPQFRGVTFDLAYSYIDVKDAAFNLGAGTDNPWSNLTTAGPYAGSATSHIHILSVAFSYQWDATR